jgi:hypothetical protein
LKGGQYRTSPAACHAAFAAPALAGKTAAFPPAQQAAGGVAAASVQLTDSLLPFGA